MTGYVRNDVGNNIADGNVIDAADLDGEFDAIVAAFNESTGHTHDGTAAEGAPITVLGPAQDYIGGVSDFSPKTDSAYDLGKTATRWANAYIDTLALTNDLAVTEGGTGASDAAGARTNLGVVIGTDVQAWDADLDTYAANPLTAAELGELQNIGTTTISALQWGYLGAMGGQPLESTDIGSTVQAWDADLDTYSANGLTAAELGQLQNIGTTTISATQWGYLGGAGAYAGTLLGTTTESNFKQTVNLEIGVDVQAFDSGLTTYAATPLTTAELQQLQNIGTTTISSTQWGYLGGASTYAGTLLGTTSEANFKQTVNLEIGTDVQAYDADLSTIAGLAKTNGNFIVGNGTNWVAESGSTARASLGLTEGIVTTSIASQAEAEAGTNNTNLMTPLRTAQAIAELAGGSWEPYDGSTGVFYDFSIDGSVSTIETPTFADGFEYMVIGEDLNGSGVTNRQLRVQFYYETDAAYGSALAFSTNAPANALDRDFILTPLIPQRSTFASGHGVRTVWWNEGASSTTGTTFLEQIRSTKQKIGKYRFDFNGTTFTGGTMALYRRKSWA